MFVEGALPRRPTVWGATPLKAGKGGKATGPLGIGRAFQHRQQAWILLSCKHAPASMSLGHVFRYNVQLLQVNRCTGGQPPHTLTPHTLGSPWAARVVLRRSKG